MKQSLIIALFVFLFYACHKEKSHPDACFTVANPVMAFGDTVRMELCGRITRESQWDMGDTVYKQAETPKHVYKAKGTYLIILKSSEHIDGFGIFTHWQNRATSEAHQTVSVQ